MPRFQLLWKHDGLKIFFPRSRTLLETYTSRFPLCTAHRHHCNNLIYAIDTWNACTEITCTPPLHHRFDISNNCYQKKLPRTPLVRFDTGARDKDRNYVEVQRGAHRHGFVCTFFEPLFGPQAQLICACHPSQTAMLIFSVSPIHLKPRHALKWSYYILTPHLGDLSIFERSPHLNSIGSLPSHLYGVC